MKSKINLGIRADANHNTGFGHLKRCIVLAKEVKSKADIIFLCKNKESIELVTKEGFKFIKLGNNEIEDIKKSGINNIFIDLKEKVGKKYIADIKKIKEPAITTIIYDNDGPGIKTTDIVIIPIVYENKRLFKSVKGRLYYGFEYAIIDKKFFGKRKKYQGKKRILVAMGGSDVNNTTKKVVLALKELKDDFECTVVIGPGFKNQNVKIKDKRFIVKKDVKNMAELMLHSDIGLILYGVSAYEAVAARLPTIMIADEHNLNEAKKFCEKMDCVYTGDSRNVDKLKIANSLMLLKTNKRLKMAVIRKNNIANIITIQPKKRKIFINAQKILVLGCNPDQIPFIKEIKKLGYYIVGTDLNEYAPGVRFLNKYYKASYEDPEKLIKIGKKEGFTSKDMVFTAASQFAYTGASQFAEYFGIDFINPKVVDICLDKFKFYKFFENIRVPIPETFFVKNKKELIEKTEKKDYFLKSDFSKNPRYIYQIKEGKIPEMNWKKDRYFRKYYILQETITGTHYRVNYYKNNFFYFKKETDKKSFPIKGLPRRKNQQKIEKDIRKIIKFLELERFFVKFDIIIDNANNKHYFIDIGLDPPMRYHILCKRLGFNFPKLYVEHYLKNTDYPHKKKLVKNIMIK